MRSLFTFLSLTIIVSACATVLTSDVEARERNTSFTTYWQQLRHRTNTTQPAPPPTSTVTPPKTESEVNSPTADQYLETVRAEVHRLTNLERSKAGVPTLKFDAALAQVAEAHSEDMLKRDYFSHTSPEGCNMACRLTKAEYAYWAWGENIAWRKSGTQPEAKVLAKHFVDSWMASSGHRRNILSKDFTHEGIGLARSGNLVYATASFADPR